jgi:hypothetical protein
MLIVKNELTAPPDGNRSAPADEVWLDKQDMLTRLHISSRTLQTWRSKGIIPLTGSEEKLITGNRI